MAGGAIRWTSRAAGRGAGATAPGAVALRLAPELLTTLSRGRRIAVVSATNGKTTTARMLVVALAQSSLVLSNAEGSNLARGVLSSLMTDRRRQRPTCVFEVDELALASVSAAVAPALFVLGNLSRDQLDRMTEVRVLAERWSAALAASAGQAAAAGTPPATVIANCDDPQVTAAVMGEPDAVVRLEVVWVAAGQLWVADAAACPVCATPWTFARDYTCTACRFARPAPTWSLDGGELYGPEGLRTKLQLGIPGRANRANAAMAVAAAVTLGADPLTAVKAVSTVDAVAGRYATYRLGGAEVRLLLAKNPASWQEMLAQSDDEQEEGVAPIPLVLVLNAQAADGRDTSWIWDVPFERLAGRAVRVSGERAADLAVRLRYAEVPFSLFDDPMQAVEDLAATEAVERIDLLANYTAFEAIRGRLDAR